MITNKTPAFFLSLAILMSLSACNGQSQQSLAIPSYTPEPPVSIRPSQTMALPTLTPGPTRTSTTTPVPLYKTKQVLFYYTVRGYHTPFEMYYADYGMDGWSKLVLYTDGQLIIPGKTFQQKILSPDEIHLLMSQLEAKGLFLLAQDNLYNFGNQDPPRVFDGCEYCVTVTEEREQNLCAYEPYETFLVPEMKNILKFLDAYHPQEMTPYYPDRILLWVRAGRSTYVENLPEKAISWPEKFSSLETSDEKIIYFQGDAAREIFALFGNTVSTIVFNQNDKEYTVSMDIILPHEQLSQP